MKILYYDCSVGISGDMHLGALLDLGVDPGYLKDELSKLGLDNEFRIEIQKKSKMGITGTKADVILTGEDHADAGEEEHDHDHDHDHEHEHNHADMHGHIHENQHDHGHDHAALHSHRNLHDIAGIINTSSLRPEVKKRSYDIFLQVAEAEAKVHGKPIEEVHFHEVGAVDSIVDIVGAAVCLDYLKIDKIMSSAVQVGGGFVKCAHGLLPVPAPATAEILKNIPIRSGLVPYETTTPTGAAILAANVNEFSDSCSFRIEKIGYGLGSRDMDVPNLLRVYLGSDDKQDEGILTKRQYMIETNIDDMNPELYGYVEEQLFLQGALDVYKTPVIMKKGRPAIKLSVLADESKVPAVEAILFRETSALGLRKYEVEKVMLERAFETIQTKFGELNVKKAFYDGKVIKYKPEYEECRQLAMKNHIAIQEIYREVTSVMEAREK